MQAMIRPYRPEDLGAVLRLWDLVAPAPDGLSLDQAVDLVSSDAAVTLVAEQAGGGIAGVGVGVTSAVVGFVYRLSAAPDSEGAAHQLLEHLEARLVEEGARKLVALVHDGEGSRSAFEGRGYRAVPSMAYLERQLRTAVPGAGDLGEAGAEMVDPGLWERLKGMEEPKQIIERTVILPLAEPALAARHSVSPPKAIMVFGPPGTGKTSFVKALASRLGWPFVEIQPADLAGEGSERQAKLLAQSFDCALKLASAVVFVDEVEDLASIRHEQRKVRPSVTNEFLKQVPRMREADSHLLVCATNYVSQLDPAFLRPGRFSYVLPIGPPDAEARGAIWENFVSDITDEDVDMGALVKATELFTPADIEFAARQAAQRAFEREHFQGMGSRATTQDFLAAVSGTKPSLSEDMVDAFQRDARRFTRY